MRYILFALTFLVATSLFAQKMPTDYFEEAGKYFEEKEYKKALQAYQYLVDHYPKNELYPRAFYNTGVSYVQLHRNEEAIRVFKEILQRNFNEEEPLGGGIMADPYTNYRHKASEFLSEIYYEEKRYDTALYYFALSDTVYPYKASCGNAYAEQHVYAANRYAAIYEKQGKQDKAIAALLPAVFVSFADNRSVINKLQILLARRKGLQHSLDLALEDMYSRQISYRDNYFTEYYLRFLDTEITVPGIFGLDEEYLEEEEKPFNKKKAIKQIRETRFYKMIAAL